MMTDETFIRMHADHSQWLHEHGLWNQDLLNWRKEHEQALTDWKELEAALQGHDGALRAHAEAMRQHEERLSANEQALLEYQQGGAAEEIASLAQAEERDGILHAQQRAAHERLKRRHHTVMAQLALLRQLMIDSEEPSSPPLDES